MKNIYNVTEVAKLFNLSKSCIYKKFENGEIEGFKIGSAVRFTEENIQTFISKCKTEQNKMPIITNEYDLSTWTNP
jgi:excisionase family DNA binding protein